VSNRSRDLDTLFQRLTPEAVTADPVTAIDAARAVDEWPLLAMLAPSLPAARLPHHMMMAVEEIAPLTAESLAVDPAPESESVFESEPIPEAPKADASLSPLEQLFRRAEQTGKPQTWQPSVFVAAEETSAPLTAPPPLKVPSQRRLTPPTARSSAAVAGGARTVQTVENAITIEPRAKAQQAPDLVPEHLFERIGAR
jgi:hypothetical protein